MPKYNVTAIIGASASVEVEADSPEAALESVGSPTVCHHCSREISLGDPDGGIVMDAGGEVLLEVAPYAEICLNAKVAKLEAELADRRIVDEWLALDDEKMLVHLSDGTLCVFGGGSCKAHGYTWAELAESISLKKST